MKEAIQLNSVILQPLKHTFLVYVYVFMCVRLTHPPWLWIQG